MALLASLLAEAIAFSAGKGESPDDGIGLSSITVQIAKLATEAVVHGPRHREGKRIAFLNEARPTPWDGLR